MEITKYQVDAFANKVFQGNPAAVCPLDEFLADEVLQAIALEHNLSETAFIVPKGSGYEIRWFTPKAEVALCGHATLASAYIIFEKLGFQDEKIVFETRMSGVLTVSKVNGMYELNFPSNHCAPSSFSKSLLSDALNVDVEEIYDGTTDCLAILKNESAVKYCDPDISKLSKIDRRGIIISSKSDEVDFVSRFFAPKVGVNEDPVTGSAHTMLIPFWSKRLDKINMVARQLSERSGTLYCTYLEDRVLIAGQTQLYSEGKIYLNL